MSAKEKLLELVGAMPDTANWDELFSAIRERLVREEEWDSSEVTHEDWMLMVAQGLHDELADESQDIYTEADGVPIR